MKKEEKMGHRNRYFAVSIVVAVFFLTFCAGSRAQTGVATYAGALPDGSTYLIEVPANWNGILFLYSHGPWFPVAPILLRTSAIQ